MLISVPPLFLEREKVCGITNSQPTAVLFAALKVFPLFLRQNIEKAACVICMMFDIWPVKSRGAAILHIFFTHFSVP